MRITQIIIVRLQRVTFTALHNYLGFTSEMMRMSDYKKSKKAPWSRLNTETEAADSINRKFSSNNATNSSQRTAEHHHHHHHHYHHRHNNSSNNNKQEIHLAQTASQKPHITRMDSVESGSEHFVRFIFRFF